MRPTVLAILVLLASAVQAQTTSVIVVDLGNNTWAAIVTLPSGQVVAVPAKVFRMPTPQPIALAAKAYLIRETREMDQGLADLEALIRLNPTLSKKLKYLDPTMVDQTGQTPDLLKAINDRIGDQLPRLVAVDESGSVVDDKPLPTNVQGVASILEGWGL